MSNDARMAQPGLRIRGARLALALTVCAAAWAVAAMPAAAANWHTGLRWQGRTARVTRRSGGGYVLHSPVRTRIIRPQPDRVRTASTLFDALFAMAQSDLRRDSVNAIHDPAFNHDKPIPCRCFIAGKDWPFAWTRDLSYSTDLALWRFDPRRARTSLLFKLSPVRTSSVRPGLYVMEDTGSGGSWPVSTDRMVWFLGARHLLGDRRFAATVYRALQDNLAQDRRYAFDPHVGLYRGETSFLDWRQQTYPEWTAHNVVFIAQSFALSTNVLHYEALRLAATLARQRGHAALARRYGAQAGALRTAINRWFWQPQQGLYMSYVGGRVNPAPYDAYDLLGIDLAITSGVAPPARARRALARYPSWPAGSPVIWPERRDQPIYHNRAIWPFVSDYTLRAARRVRDVSLITHELHSLVRGAALAGSNMENFSLRAQSTHVPGRLGGPVVDSRRQLWSVAGYLDMVVRGVFGVRDDGSIHPELPAALVPMLFGTRQTINLRLGARRIVLVRPARIDGNLLVRGSVRRQGPVTRVQLVSRQVAVTGLRLNAPMYLPPTPPAPVVTAQGMRWHIDSAVPGVLYVNGRRWGPISRRVSVARRDGLQCFSVTARGAGGLQSLHSRSRCVGPVSTVGSAWPRHWTAPRAAVYLAWVDYDNDHGPISTGITAAVRRMVIRCAGEPRQRRPLVMPQSDGVHASTVVRFRARAGARCTFRLTGGFNMSDLARYAYYTGGQGGAAGPVNRARIFGLHIAPLAPERRR
ncbi:MAG: Six-hairpin glycosidase-like protein [Pseudomonadota bacterium]|jgi:hypothetical protein|nr:Six-hairpin glycosidase-like protein [Pseudomonadota bacterium]